MELMYIPLLSPKLEVMFLSLEVQYCFFIVPYISNVTLLWVIDHELEVMYIGNTQIPSWLL